MKRCKGKKVKEESKPSKVVRWLPLRGGRKGGWRENSSQCCRKDSEKTSPAKINKRGKKGKKVFGKTANLNDAPKET